MDTKLLITHYINIDCTRGKHGKLSPRKKQCRPMLPMLPSHALKNYNIILNVNKIHRLHKGWFPNNPGQLNV